nr:sj ts4 protein [Hymenolepis microstoma]
MMSNFSERVSNYPLVNDSLKAASNAYNWAASSDLFRSIFQLTESAAVILKEKAASVANTDAVAKLDEMACHHILDRFEAIFPSVKKPTEDLIGPTVDRILDVAENHFEYFLPETKTKIEGEPAATRYERLMRLQKALASSEKVQAAQEKISNTYKGIEDKIVALSTVATRERRDALLCSISNLATEYKQNAEVVYPRFKSFVTGAVSQLQTFTHDLSQMKTDTVTQLAIDQIQATINGLHNTLQNLNELREKWLRGAPEPETEKKPELTDEAKVETDKKNQ